MKNFKLAFTDSTTYNGIDAEGFYSKALLTGKSTSNFKLIANVKSKIKLAKLDMGELLQDADCTFSGAGEGTLSQKSFEVEPIKINLSYCQRTFETNYLSELMRAGSNSDQVMPENIEAYLLGESAKQASNDLEKVTWEGDTGSAVYPFMRADGIIKKALADATVNDIASPVALTAANIVAKIGLVYDAIPAEILNKEDTVMFVGTSAYKFYRQALANASAETYLMQNHSELSYLGMLIVEAPGMGAGTIIAGQKSNFVFLTDLVSDFEEVQVLPQKAVTGEPVVRMIAEFKFGVDYLYGSEIVLYRA
jgi:hypothetical protein